MSAKPAVVRPQRSAERRQVRVVIVSSFGEEVVADLAEALQDAPAGASGLSFVADLDGHLVGHVQLSRSWVDARPAGWSRCSCSARSV